MAVTNDDLKKKQLEVLNAQKELFQAQASGQAVIGEKQAAMNARQSEMNVLSVQKKIDDLEAQQA